LKKCYGVEIIPELYESSVAVLDQFRKNILCLDEADAGEGVDSSSGSRSGEEEEGAGAGALYAAHRACEMEVALGDILVEEFIAEWASAGMCMCMYVFQPAICPYDTGFAS